MKTVVRIGLLEKLTLNKEGGERVSPADLWEKDVKGAVSIQNSQRKSPKAGHVSSLKKVKWPVRRKPCE